jgi:hypothetical protein
VDLDLPQHQVALVDQEEVAVVPLQEAHNLVDLLYLAKVIMVGVDKFLLRFKAEAVEVPDHLVVMEIHLVEQAVMVQPHL